MWTLCCRMSFIPSCFKINVYNFAVILVQIFVLYLKFRLFCFKCRFDFENRPVFWNTVACRGYDTDLELGWLINLRALTSKVRIAHRALDRRQQGLGCRLQPPAGSRGKNYSDYNERAWFEVPENHPKFDPSPFGHGVITWPSLTVFWIYDFKTQFCNS